MLLCHKIMKRLKQILRYIKVHALVDKIKLTKTDLRMCIWICFQRYKFILNDNKINLNMEDENNYLNEYLKLKKIHLETKKYSSNYLKNQ